MHIILLCTYTFFQDSYTVPLTSIQCWHVHCEECWLRTLVRWTFIILHLTKDVQHNHVTSTSEPCMLLSVVLIDKLSFSQGAKKLCPQCNTITSPGDLRRVYLWKVTAVLSSALTDHFNWGEPFWAEAKLKGRLAQQSHCPNIPVGTQPSYMKTTVFISKWNDKVLKYKSAVTIL